MEGFSVGSKGLLNPVILALAFVAGSIVESDVGKFVKLTGNMSVGLCADGDTPLGQIVAIEKASSVVSVQIAGSGSTSYSGTDPSVGVKSFLADASGGLKIGAGANFTVLSVDSVSKKFDFIKNF